MDSFLAAIVDGENPSRRLGQIAAYVLLAALALAVIQRLTRSKKPGPPRDDL